MADYYRVILLLELFLILTVDVNAVNFYRRKPEFTPAKLSIDGFLETTGEERVDIAPDEDVEIHLQSKDAALDSDSQVRPRLQAGYPGTEPRFLSISTAQASSNQLVPQVSPLVLPIPNPFGRYVKVFETATVTQAIVPVCLACTCLVGPAAKCSTCNYNAAFSGKDAGADKADQTACLQGETKCSAYCIDPDVFSRSGVANRPAYCGTACECITAGKPVSCSPAASGVISTVPGVCSTASGRSLDPDARYKRSTNASDFSLQIGYGLPEITSSQEAVSEDNVRQGRFMKMFGDNVIRITNTVTQTSVLGATATLAVGGLGCLPAALASSPLC